MTARRPPGVNAGVEHLQSDLFISWSGNNRSFPFFIFQAFSKKKIEERKLWLTNFMLDRRQRRAHNLPEVPSQNSVNLIGNDPIFLSNFYNRFIVFLHRTSCTVSTPSPSLTTTLSTRSWCFSPTLTMRGPSRAWWTVREPPSPRTFCKS